MIIGKIVKSYSHINYVCQIFGPREREEELTPADYAFGQFVRIPVRSERDDDRDSLIVMSRGKTTEAQTYAIGVIYDTILANPEFGSLGPRLSNEAQVELFSPDYISEKAVLVSIMVLGMIEQRTLLPGQTEILSVMHGVPLLSLELGSEIEPMTDEAVQAFHYFGDKGQEGQDLQNGQGSPSSQQPYLHMGYIPHIIAQPNSLLPMVTLRIIEQLERLFPENLKLLSIVKRNFAWRLKVETTG
ncbi:MAG TPA: hypothetical protein VKT25_13955 [Ktedonobacteraceae bacterium]|nr:hypothetical protein [Ktedonobacteraceae bacterium]